MFSARELERMDAPTLFRREGVPRAAELAALVKPCLILEPGTSTRRTRAGGLPELAEGQPWPTTSRGHPMTFLGQLDLEQLEGLPVSGELPDHGLLGWFYADDAAPAEHAIVWSGTRAVRHVDPPAAAEVLPARGVSVRTWWSIPGRGRACPLTAALGLTDEEGAAWDDLHDEWTFHEVDLHGHRVLGYPSDSEAHLDAALDTDEELRAQFFLRGVAERAREPYRDPKLAARARAFRLLVEIHDLDGFGIGWADGAPTSFLVHEDAWRRGDFNQQVVTRCLRS